jgi:hypothetical protein
MKITGKRLGVTVLFFTQMLIIAAFFTANKSDVLSILYVQFGVMSLVWGAVSHKNHIDYKMSGKQKA